MHTDAFGPCCPTHAAQGARRHAEAYRQKYLSGPPVDALSAAEARAFNPRVCAPTPAVRVPTRPVDIAISVQTAFSSASALAALDYLGLRRPQDA